MDTKISTGSATLDWLLEGGYEKEVITTIYGPAGSGKTNLCLIFAKEHADKKIIYIDTEGSFSLSRFRQLTDDYKTALKNIILLKPTTFTEQRQAFEELKGLIDNKDVGAIIVDSIAMLYRLEIGQTKKIYEVNKQLGAQLSALTEIARKNSIPVLVTNQVYADFDQKGKVHIVGGDLLKYQSKCLIELQRTETARKAIIRKHRSIEEGKEIHFIINDLGIEEENHEESSTT